MDDYIEDDTGEQDLLHAEEQEQVKARKEQRDTKKGTKTAKRSETKRKVEDAKPIASKDIASMFAGAPRKKIAVGGDSAAKPLASAAPTPSVADDDNLLDALLAESTLARQPKKKAAPFIVGRQPAPARSAIFQSPMEMAAPALASAAADEAPIAASAFVKPAAKVARKRLDDDDMDMPDAPVPTPAIVRPPPPPAPKPVTAASTPVAAAAAVSSTLNTTAVDMSQAYDWRSAVGDETAAAAPVEDFMNLTSAVDMPVDSAGVTQFYWLDAYEEEKLKGTVFLFGRVNVEGKWISCSLTVKNIPRTIYAVPRVYKQDGQGHDTPEVNTLQDVQKELYTVATAAKIPPRSFLSKPVGRTYAFELREIQRGEAKYIKAKFPAEHDGAIFFNKTGKTFSHIFGAERSLLEQLLIKRKIMGPCYLNIAGAVTMAPEQSSAWAKLHLEVNNFKCVSVAEAQPPPPPLTVLSLVLKTCVNRRDRKNEIVAVSMLVHSGIVQDAATQNPEKGLTQFTGVRKLEQQPLPADFEVYMKQQNKKVTVHGSEFSLLNWLIGILKRVDPDMLVGHNISGFGLDLLLHRMQVNKTSEWSRVGRMKRHVFPKLGNSGGGVELPFGIRQATAGRLILDTWLSSKEYLRETNYSLQDLVRTQLGLARQEVDNDNIPMYFDNAQNLGYLMQSCDNDAFFQFQLMNKLQAIPLSKQLTNLSGNLWSRTLAGGRAERIEYLLLHEFHNRKYMVPDKLSFRQKNRIAAEAEQDGDDGPDGAAASGGGQQQQQQQQPGKGKKRGKPKYMGGLVLEPKKGLYDNYILLLDFNSLYPSIIREFNLCFTTVERPLPNLDGSVPPAQVPPAGLQTGVLPFVITTLVNKRREAKRLLAKTQDKVQQQQLDIRQMALKLTANSMYGCLGFTNSRFYSPKIAELITSKGRETLQKTVDMATNEHHLEVIYGDTDSIMINTGSTDYQAVLEKGNQMKKSVNVLYKHLEIEIDGVFRTMLLLKKKKYACLVHQQGPDGEVKLKRETKGLDMVRRDWCPLSKEIGAFVLDAILSGKAREDAVSEIHAHLREVAARIRNGEVPINKFIITKSLTKNPEDYPDAHTQPHVKVAQRLRQAGRSVLIGEHIPYVICKSESNAVAEKAYHPTEVAKSNGALVLDIEWYLLQQIHPPIARLCDPIAGTDTAQIAECLGLDTTRFHRYTGTGSHAHNDPAQRFVRCEPLMIECAHCATQSKFKGVEGRAEGLICIKCKERHSTVRLVNKLTLAIREFQTKYYERAVQCTDSGCKFRSLQIPLIARDGHIKCLMCRSDAKLEYSAKDLDDQLQYYAELTNWAKAPAVDPSIAGSMDQQRAADTYNEMHKAVAKVLETSAYFTLPAAIVRQLLSSDPMTAIVDDD
eukprot:TRINITY_DN1759_c3_g1_i1.p1 TRINITY_DN1759_c3_g1~~TRINITY_DN1759_c3_g1_i1.p1  ORF type:complete len:1451 (-),score=432.17 TRINITY_DN1759_c3_g1_i1:59-4213(-)